MAGGNYTFTEDTVVLKSATKEHQAVLDDDSTNTTLHLDTTKMTTLIKGSYQINGSDLTIQTDTGKMMFKKVR